jgi:hypothetical protein
MAAIRQLLSVLGVGEPERLEDRLHVPFDRARANVV